MYKIIFHDICILIYSIYAYNIECVVFVKNIFQAIYYYIYNSKGRFSFSYIIIKYLFKSYLSYI